MHVMRKNPTEHQNSGRVCNPFTTFFFFLFINVLTVKLHYNYKYKCRYEILQNCHVTSFAFCIKETELQRQFLVHASHDIEFQDFVICTTELIRTLLAPTSTMLEMWN
jgi:hypothetical protein